MITLEQARPALLAAVETKGRDFVYNPDNSVCFYVPNPHYQGAPQAETGCLIGVALNILGETRHLNPAPGAASNGFEGGVAALTRTFPDVMDEETSVYFGIAQSAQDSGCTWGEAYDFAEEWVVTRDRAAIAFKIQEKRRANFGPSA